jgi:hypothetical protein
MSSSSAASAGISLFCAHFDFQLWPVASGRFVRGPALRIKMVQRYYALMQHFEQLRWVRWWWMNSSKSANAGTRSDT